MVEKANSISRLPFTRIEDGVDVEVQDSHPKRSNGFLTGCLLTVMKEYLRPSIEELPRYESLFLSNQVHVLQPFTDETF